jgi:hypothetical protein
MDTRQPCFLDWEPSQNYSAKFKPMKAVSQKGST